MKHILLASVVFVGACGGGGDDKPEGDVNPDGAEVTIDHLGRISESMASGNGAGAAGSVMGLVAAGQVLIAPSSSARAEMPAAALLPLDWRIEKQTQFATGSAECNANGCVFNNYGDTYSGYTFLINGSIMASGDTLTFDLTWDMTGNDLQFHWEMDGRITVTETRIDGYVDSTGNATVTHDGRTSRIDWDIDIDYNDIGLADGCPVSGSMSASVEYRVEGSSYSASGSIGFGPACGQYR